MTKELKGEKAAKMVFQMFSFQYKPLETALFKSANPKTIRIYKTMPYSKKIKVLDHFANYMGL